MDVSGGTEGQLDALEKQRADFAIERARYEDKIARLERKVNWLKRSSIEYWLHAMVRWVLLLPDRMQLRFIRMNAIQMGNLRQYAPVEPVFDVFPKSEGDGPLPTLAIATPSYNQARYLPATVESILSQEGVEVDYFVQDGASTDGSAAYLKDSVTQGAKLRWASERDAGQADAINRGLSQCSGQIMAWINSDDTYAPGALRYVAEYFRDHPDVDVLYGHRLLVDADGKEIGRWVMPPHNDDALTYFDYVPQETLFWRREVWEKSGGIDTSFQFALDWELLLKFRKVGARIVRLPYFLACFRVHEAQKTSSQLVDTGKSEMLRLRGVDAEDEAFKKRFRKTWFYEMRAARMTWIRMKMGRRSENG